MTEAYVNGVKCTIYDYIQTDAGLVCMVLYPNYNIKLPVLAELIELRRTI